MSELVALGVSPDFVEIRLCTLAPLHVEVPAGYVVNIFPDRRVAGAQRRARGAPDKNDFDGAWAELHQERRIDGIRSYATAAEVRAIPRRRKGDARRGES